MKITNLGVLKKLIHDLPDELPINISLDSCGTAMETQFTLERVVDSPDGSYQTFPDSPSDPRPTVGLVLLENVSQEEMEKGFPEQVRLGLPEEFVDFCTRNNVTPEEVLHGFIADLCGIRNTVHDPRSDGLASHGSDERHMATEYFARTGLSR